MTGIILAGGKNSRMGLEKGLAILNNKPMFHYGIEAMTQVCDQILISTNSKEYQDSRVFLVPDLLPDRGPMGGIWSAMKSTKDTAYFVLSCDLPFVPAEFIRFLISVSADFDITVPYYGKEHFEPLCGIYRRTVLPELESHIRASDLKLPDLFLKIRLNPIPAYPLITRFNPNLFFNINTPEDLRYAEQYLK